MAPDRHQRQPDGKNTSPGLNFLVYTLVFCAIIAIGLTYLTRISTDVISYDDLIRLADATKYTKKNGELESPYTGKITVTRNGKDIEYSDLADVTVGTHVITGRVTRKVNSADKGEQIRENQSFRTNKILNEEIEKNLLNTLKEHNINYAGVQPPSIWTSYAPLFLISAVFILLFFLMLRRLGGAGSPMAFGRSRGRLYAQEDLEISFRRCGRNR